MTIATVTRPALERSVFFKGLRKRTYAYFTENGIKPDGGGAMLVKSALIILFWASCYALFLTYGAATILGAAGTLTLLAASTLLVQLGVMHDASHYSIVQKRWPNTLLRMTLTLMGGSSILWFHNHVVMHHGHTNIPGSDPDIETMGTIRFHDEDPWCRWHRWQHWYALPLYSLMALTWIWMDDFLVLVSRNRPVRGRRLLLFVLELLVSRASHMVLFLIVPYLLVGSWLAVLLGYLIFWMAFGLAMTMIFTLAHITEVQDFLPDGRPPETDWALHQLATTANFSVKNDFMTWAIGGLNFQIEHHIFPNISHRHYRKVHEIVKAYCADRGVPYHEFPTFWQAAVAHFRHLKRLSQRPASLPAAAGH